MIVLIINATLLSTSVIALVNGLLILKDTLQESESAFKEFKNIAMDIERGRAI
jgi:AmiR/NasT family two-component response regulator